MEDLITTSPELSELVEKISKALNQLIKKLAEAIHIFAKAFQEFARRVSKASYINMCGSPRVYFLAYHSKKARVRKKNKKRMMEAIRWRFQNL